MYLFLNAFNLLYPAPVTKGENMDEREIKKRAMPEQAGVEDNLLGMKTILLMSRLKLASQGLISLPWILVTSLAPQHPL